MPTAEVERKSAALSIRNYFVLLGVNVVLIKQFSAKILKVIKQDAGRQLVIVI